MSTVQISGKASSNGKFNSSEQSGGGTTLLTRLDLTGGVPSGSGPGSWGFGAQSGAAITVVNDGTYKYLRGQYPIDVTAPPPDQVGDNYIYGGYTPLSLEQDLYIQFYARMPGVKGGMKFIKFFGHNATGGANEVANATFGLDFTGSDYGAFEYIGYGDGTTLSNDTQNGVALYTPNYINSGRTGTLGQSFVRTTAFASSEWGTGWHKFQMRLRQNSGTSTANEINDGVVEVIIDDIVRGRGVNIFNRNALNGFIETIGLFGYSRKATAPFEMHIREGLTISRGGYVS